MRAPAFLTASAGNLLRTLHCARSRDDHELLGAQLDTVNLDNCVRRFEFPTDKFVRLGDRNHLLYARSGLDAREVAVLNRLHHADNRAVSAAGGAGCQSHGFQRFDYATDFRDGGVCFHDYDHCFSGWSERTRNKFVFVAAYR